jgi:hypothetical protein
LEYHGIFGGRGDEEESEGRRFHGCGRCLNKAPRKSRDAGVDRAALPARIETMTVEPKDEKGDRHGWLDLLRE